MKEALNEFSQKPVKAQHIGEKITILDTAAGRLILDFQIQV